MIQYVADFLIFFPVLIGIIGLLVRERSDRIWLAAVVSAGFASIGALVALIAAYLRSDFDLEHWTLISWAPHWGFEIGLHIDFFSAAQALLVSWLFLTSFSLARESFSGHRSKLVASLTLCSAMLGAVLSANLLTFLAFSAAASLFASFLLGLEKSPDAPQDAVRLGMVALSSDLLLLICVLGTNKQIVAGDMFKFVLLGNNISGDTVLFFIFLFAALFKTPLPPFHPHHSSIFRSIELDHLLPRAVLGGLGLFLIFRFMPQLYPGQLKQFATTLMGFGMFSILAGGLYVLKARGIRAWLFASGLILSGLAVSGFASISSLGWLGGWIVYWFGAIAVALAIGLSVVAERRPNTFSINAVREAPFFGFFAIVSVTAIAGMPISLLYFGIVFIFGGAASAFSGFAWIAFIAVPLILGGAIYRLFFQFQAGEKRSATGGFTDLTFAEKVALSPLLIFLVGTFLCSGYVLTGIGRAVNNAISLLGWGG